MARPMVNLRKNASMVALIDAAEREVTLARERYFAACEAVKAHRNMGNDAQENEYRRQAEALFPLVDGMDLMLQHMKRLAAQKGDV